jgi:hypothetical protein
LVAIKLPDMKHTVLTLCIFLFGFSSHAQPLYVNWTKYIGGTGGDLCWHAISTSDGGIVFVGRTTDTLGSGDIPSSPPDSQSIQSNNVIIGKLDSNKHLSWLKVYGGRRMDQGVKVVEVHDGGLAVLALTESYSGDISFSRGSQEIWLLRLDSTGNLLWEKTYGSTEGDGPIAFSSTSDNGFIVLGASLGADYDVPFHYGSSSFSYDWFVFRVDSVGNVQWAKTIGGTGNDDYINSNIFQVGNSYYLIGSSDSRDNDCTDTSWHVGTTTGMDIFMLKIDSVGNVLWNKSYGGTGIEDWSSAVFDVRDSSIVIAVRSTSHDYLFTNSYSVPVFATFKTDLDGNLFWVAIAGDSMLYCTPMGILPYGDSAYLLSSFAATDYWLGILENSGTFGYYKKIGGLQNEMPFPSIIPYNEGYAIVGTTFSQDMYEGGKLNDLRNSVDVFVSGVDSVYAPVKLKNTEGKQYQLKVYPNPAKNIVSITLPKKEGILTVSDNAGKAVYKERITNERVDIDISSWSRGIYLINWKSGKGAWATEKLINN